MCRIVGRRIIDDEQRTVQPGLLLPHFVDVRVVDERAGARRRESRFERRARFDRGGQPGRTARETCDTIVVAFELMPCQRIAVASGN